MAEQVTKKQHFAPKFYFKRFADPKNFLEVLDIKNARILPHKPYAGVCYADYFYAQETGVPDKVSQEIEAILKATEDIVAPEYDRIVGEILNDKQITEDDQYRLAWFMASLWMRNPTMREGLNRMSIDMTKQINKTQSHHPKFGEYIKRIMEEKGEPITDEQVEIAKEVFQSGDYELKMDNSSHLNMFSEMQGFVNLVFAKKWRIYISNEEDFITSDTPVIEIFPERKGPYGPTFFDRKHTFVMTPKIVIELISPGLPGKKIKRKRVDAEQVTMLNLDRVKWSYQYCYAGKQEGLQNMLKFYQGKKVAPYLPQNDFANNGKKKP